MKSDIDNHLFCSENEFDFYKNYLETFESVILKDICNYNNYIPHILDRLIEYKKYGSVIKVYSEYKRANCARVNIEDEIDVLSKMLKFYSQHNVPELAYVSLRYDVKRLFDETGINNNQYIELWEKTLNKRSQKLVNVWSVALIIYSIVEIGGISVGDYTKNGFIDTLILLILLGGVLFSLYLNKKNIGLYLDIVSWVQKVIFWFKYGSWMY